MRFQRQIGSTVHRILPFFSENLKNQLQFAKKNGKITCTIIPCEGGATMPNIKSAKKRVKVIAVKTAQNKRIKSDLKTALKKADLAIQQNSENKQELVKAASIKLDQAVTKGILHKNNAARKKSQLACKAK